MRRVFILFLICFPLVAFAKERVMLMGMAIQPSATATRIIFTLSEQTAGRVKILSSPPRVSIYFANTAKRFQMHNAKLGGANVLEINSSEEGNDLHFVFKVKGSVKTDVHYLPKEGATERLQLEIRSTEKSKATSSSKPIYLGNRANKTKPLLPKLHVFTIVIDAGHGGKDTGALGPHGTREKDVVLGIAKKLAAEINKQGNVHAVLTRHNDSYLKLRQRLRLARKGKADLFIAIHADAYFEAGATGASVYALSEHGATTEAARWLAKRDNYSELDGVELNSLPDNSPMLRSVLIDLAQTATIQDSLRLGNRILKALDSVSSLHYTQVQQAPFMVLKSPDIPSILVETGFISNPKEEARLNNAQYQQKLAKALWQGINQYAVKYGYREQ